MVELSFEVVIKTSEGKVVVATDVGLDVDPSASPAVVALSLGEEVSAGVQTKISSTTILTKLIHFINIAD